MEILTKEACIKGTIVKPNPLTSSPDYLESIGGIGEKGVIVGLWTNNTSTLGALVKWPNQMGIHKLVFNRFLVVYQAPEGLSNLETLLDKLADKLKQT